MKKIVKDQEKEDNTYVKEFQKRLRYAISIKCKQIKLKKKQKKQERQNRRLGRIYNKTR